MILRTHYYNLMIFRAQMHNIREQLKVMRRRLGPPPFGRQELHTWDTVLAALAALAGGDVASVNRNIDKYNLVVPMMHGQMFHFDLAREADKVLREHVPEQERARETVAATKEEEAKRTGLFEMITEVLSGMTLGGKKS